MAPSSLTAIALTLLIPSIDGPRAPGVSEGLSLYQAGHMDEAAALLSACLDKEPQATEAAEGFYALASIHFARGETAQARNALLRLLEHHAKAPWALNAYDRLGSIALAERQWARARELTEAFLERYLSMDQAAIDDAICRRMFDRLVACRAGEHPGTDQADLRSQVRHGYPEPNSSAAGRVAALYGRLDPRTAHENLVVNPGFELDAGIVGIPAGWSYRGTEPLSGDDLDGTMSSDGGIPVHAGRFCAGKFTSYGRHRGWLYQRVHVVPGRRYDVSAFGMTPAQGDGAGVLRIGADLRGGIDPLGTGVVWTRSVSAKEDYVRIGLEGAQAVEAGGPEITVFLEFRQDTPAADNEMLFDDVQIREAKE